MAATRNKKRLFPCGHVGHGDWCHRCEQARVSKDAKETARLVSVKKPTGTVGHSQRKRGARSNQSDPRVSGAP